MQGCRKKGDLTMATLTVDKSGKTPGYLIQYCENGKRYSLYLGGKRFTRNAAEQLKEIIETLILYRHSGVTVLDKRTHTWLETASPIIKEKLAKVGLIEIPQRHTCKELWTEYLNQKTDVKSSTFRLYNTSRKKFFDFFSELELIGQLDQDRMKEWIKSMRERNAETSIALYIRHAKSVFNWSIKEKKWLFESPLAGIGNGSFENHEKDRIVTLQEYRKLLSACPNQEWRTIIALARIGGLRCPSELMPLR
jgi:hypothetical protein